LEEAPMNFRDSEFAAHPSPEDRAQHRRRDRDRGWFDPDLSEQRSFRSRSRRLEREDDFGDLDEDLEDVVDFDDDAEDLEDLDDYEIDDDYDDDDYDDEAE
jgi:hypothetical protein